MAILVASKGKPGGVERRFMCLARNFVSDRVSCTFMAQGSLIQEFNALEIPSVELSQNNLFGRVIEILKSLKENNINHLHIASNPSLLSLFLTVAGRCSGFRVSISSVDSSKISFKQFSVLSIVSHFLTYLFARRIDFLSEEIYKVHSKLFPLNRRKCFVSPCSFLASDIKPLTTNERTYDLCFVSRLVPLKGFELLIGALAKLKRPTTVRICGEGELRSYFNSRVTELAHHSIDIGYCDNPVEVLSRSKIFVSLQSYNNYPSQSLFEAIKCECAIIATDVGETRKILDEKNSILINTLSELHDAIDLLLSDDDLRKQIRNTSTKQVFENHNVDKFKQYFLNKIVEI